MVLSLSAYLSPDTRDNLDRLRGGKGFADALKVLKPGRYFARDREEDKILDSGHDFQVFRRHLIKDWFFPTFYFQKEQIEVLEQVSEIKTVTTHSNGYCSGNFTAKSEQQAQATPRRA